MAAKKKKNRLNLGTGLTYIQLRYAEPFVFYNPNTNELIVGINESNRMQDDAGLLLHADYGINVGKFTFGVRSELHFLFGIGLGGVIISPNVQIRY